MSVVSEIIAGLNIFNPSNKSNNNKAKSGSNQKASGVSDRPKRQKKVELTDKIISQHYKRRPYSFADMMPFMEYLDDHGTFLLEDGFSQAAVLSITPIPTEGRGDAQLKELCDQLELTFSKAFTSGITGDTEWILQTYSFMDDDLYRYIQDVRAHIKQPEISNSQWTEHYLEVMEKHFRGINNPKGIFKDDMVTGKQWRGQIRRTYAVIYRRCSQRELNDVDFNPTEQLQRVTDQFTKLLENSPAKARLVDGVEFFTWLTDWFNPKPGLTGGDREALYKAFSYLPPEDRPYGYNLTEAILHSEPISDPDNRCWWFDDMPHRFVRIKGLRGKAKIGQMTGEITTGSGKNMRSTCLMDSLPQGAVYHQTIVFIGQEVLDKKFISLSSAEKGETKEARDTTKALQGAIWAVENNVEIYHASMGIFLRSEDLRGLRGVSQELTQSLINEGLEPLLIEHDHLAVESYPLHLPMNFEPNKDKDGVYLQLFYARQLACLSPFWGREQGTGKPGLINWNRGGEPLTFDMFGDDRVRSAHGVLVGPQGSGKSATLNQIAAATMAMSRPRMFIIDKGGSFALLGEYFSRFGLHVNILKINPRMKNSLCPFLDSHLIFEQEDPQIFDRLDELDEYYEDDDDAFERDVMGEMVTSLKIMVSGGQQKVFDSISQVEVSFLRSAITLAAEKCRDEDRKCLTEDVQNALRIVAKHEDVSEKYQERLMEFIMAMDTFTTGLEGHIFNREGEPWPDADVTIIDMGHFASDGYDAQLALAYIGLMMHITNLGERHQNDWRDVVCLTDEAHLYAGKPLLANYIAVNVKLQRKLGVWSLFATQNMEDFKHGSERILKIIEWWVCLNLEEAEIEDLEKFRSLSKEQKQMMLSATKQDKCYTEGIVMGNRKKVGEMMVRFVPPSIFLTLAMTDTKEKAERAQLMRDHNLRSHTDAAIMMATELDKLRNIHVKAPKAIPVTHDDLVISE